MRQSADCAAGDSICFRAAQEKELPVFSQYLLPAARRAGHGEERHVILGAVWRNLACGAAALRLSDGEGAGSAELLSLFVDPGIRGRGAGAGLLALAVETAKNDGAEWLDASYVAEPEDVEILRHMFLQYGAEPESKYATYSMSSALFHDEALFGDAFSFRYRPPKEIVRFMELRPGQLAALEAEAEVPGYLTPGNRPAMDPALSLAWTGGDGRVLGFSLVCMTGPGQYANLSAWRSRSAPKGCFRSLLAAQLHLCFYHGGGDFIYHVCSISARTDAVVERYTGGRYDKKRLYSVRLSLR